MKNTDIKYQLSTDYLRLYELLRSGYQIVAFVKLDINTEAAKEYSRLVTLKYSKDFGEYDLGNGSYSQEEIKDAETFAKVCASENIRYFDVKVELTGTIPSQIPEIEYFELDVRPELTGNIPNFTDGQLKQLKDFNL